MLVNLVKRRKSKPLYEIVYSNYTIFPALVNFVPEKNYPNNSFSSENNFLLWKNFKSPVQDHENNPAHRSTLLDQKELEGSLNKVGLTDDRLQQQITKAIIAIIATDYDIGIDYDTFEVFTYFICTV